MYSGARVNEIAQLKLHDIVQEDGVWCIAIQLTADEDLADNEHFKTRQTVKGQSALRRIPIHQAVLDAGFLDFLEDIKACGHARLFPNLSAGVCEASGETNARYSQGLVIQFSAYLKKLGFDKGIGFHAFRHTLSTKLGHAQLTQEDVATTTGRSESNRFPILNLYQTTPDPDERGRQTEALKRFQPPVTLPKCKRGSEDSIALHSICPLLSSDSCMGDKRAWSSASSGAKRAANSAATPLSPIAATCSRAPSPSGRMPRIQATTPLKKAVSERSRSQLAPNVSSP
ncbi:tyrosine-type recombinase/integrase [Stenotrophomonas rhizophila]|uniref:tyrosine-type recombinase/integrase n=1 Tax=Stenotrophomonas rhizophila TaxID=216778 RepID=UPI0028A75154|nr:tyrosine-type recombinase/integrase [Stenotrophomonas rhizophila]